MILSCRWSGLGGTAWAEVMLAGWYGNMDGSRIRGDDMWGENLAGRGIRSSVAMLSGMLDATTGLVACASESLKLVLSVEELDVDK